MSALSRRRASGDLAQQNFLAIRSRLCKDRDYWERVKVGEPVLLQAEEPVQQTNMRTLDAIHSASAMIFRSGRG